jgi:hypothetical protein
MNDTRDLTQRSEPPRRRFLGFLGALLGGVGAMGLARQPQVSAAAPRDLALKEADFYRPHDLAG